MYQIAAIIAALDAAVARGVRVDLILESPEHLDGGGGAAAYAKYRVYHWPADRRDPPDAKLHAKAVIVDNRGVLLTSANMTNAAYDKNIELGVLRRGGTTAARVQNHFDELITRGELRSPRSDESVDTSDRGRPAMASPATRTIQKYTPRPEPIRKDNHHPRDIT